MTKNQIDIITVHIPLKMVIARPRSGRGNLVPSPKERDCFVAALLAMTAPERLLTIFVSLIAFSTCVFAQERIAVNDVRWQDGNCPVCGKKVKLAVVTATNTTCGIDRDLFIRSAGPQPEFYLIDTCPNCCFSGYLNDFDLVLPQQVKDNLKKTLKPPHPINPKIHQQEIATLDKYELAYQTFKILGRSDESFGWLTLRASWIARDLYCNLPKHPAIVDVLIEAGKLVPPAGKDSNPAEREVRQAKKLALHMTNSKTKWNYDAVIALLYRRHGENRSALKSIDRIGQNKNTPADIRDLFVQMKRSIATEQHWQELSAEHFNRAFTTGTISPANQAIAKYLLAQLYHRLGKKDEARRWLNEAILDRRLPANLLQWAKETQEQRP